MPSTLVDRYADRISGVLSCYDRMVITGTLPSVCYAEGMTKFLNAHHVRIFDYAKFAEPLRDRVREQAVSLAAGVSIQFIAKSHIRKEAVVAKVLEQRGEHPGLVHVISAMEACDTYKPWHNKQTHKTYVRPDSGKCLHYYFYFMDAELGLVYLRVPTPACVLGESHVSLQPHFEHPAVMDCVEPLHAAAEGNRSWWLVVAVPTAETGDDPARPGKTFDRLRVFLSLGVAFERRDQSLDGVHLRLGEDRGPWQLMFSVALLGQLDIDTGRLHRRRRKLHQTFRAGELAVFQLQPLGFQHPEQLLDDPAKPVPVGPRA